ncbi:hypothetical protein Tamer19_33980 [Cupriavidus sp. TA19]|nr:hypothetical protein Tamer19_33980 [Cupriavidus sp. TA19]
MIPFYEHAEWAPCPRMPITLNDQLCFAYDTSPKGKSWQPERGRGPRIGMRMGMLNGATHEFLLTNGEGRGEVGRYYVYFKDEGRLYFVHTGDSWPKSVDIRTMV